MVSGIAFMISLLIERMSIFTKAGEQPTAIETK
jgi:hypothetical protein